MLWPIIAKTNTRSTSAAATLCIVLRNMKAHGGLFVIIFTCVGTFFAKTHYTEHQQIVRAGFAVMRIPFQLPDSRRPVSCGCGCDCDCGFLYYSRATKKICLLLPHTYHNPQWPLLKYKLGSMKL
jgi:hypothetical protein